MFTVSDCYERFSNLCHSLPEFVLIMYVSLLLWALQLPENLSVLYLTFPEFP